MFNPIPQMIKGSQHRRGALNGTRIMAALALLFSVLAFLMAGAVMLRTGPEEGGLKANLESFRTEAGKVVSDIRDRFRSRNDDDGPADAGDEAVEAQASEPPRSAVPEEETEWEGDPNELDRIRERVDEIEDRVLAEDETAGDMLDELKDDLAGLKDFSKEDGKEWLDRIGESLSRVRESIAEDSAEAARRLRALSEDLVRRSREQTERLRSGPDPTPTPEG